MLHGGFWEETARRISREGSCVDTDRMRVQIEIDADRYRQINTVRIGTPSELVAN